MRKAAKGCRHALSELNGPDSLIRVGRVLVVIIQAALEKDRLYSPSRCRAPHLCLRKAFGASVLFASCVLRLSPVRFLLLLITSCCDCILMRSTPYKVNRSALMKVPCVPCSSRMWRPSHLKLSMPNPQPTLRHICAVSHGKQANGHG